MKCKIWCPSHRVGLDEFLVVAHVIAPDTQHFLFSPPFSWALYELEGRNCKPVNIHLKIQPHLRIYQLCAKGNMVNAEQLHLVNVPLRACGLMATSWWVHHNWDDIYHKMCASCECCNSLFRCISNGLILRNVRPLLKRIKAVFHLKTDSSQAKCECIAIVVTVNYSKCLPPASSISNKHVGQRKHKHQWVTHLVLALSVLHISAIIKWSHCNLTSSSLPPSPLWLVLHDNWVSMSRIGCTIMLLSDISLEKIKYATSWRRRNRRWPEWCHIRENR